MARFGAHKFFVGIACLIWASASNGSDVVWQQLEPGLELGSAVSKTSGVPAGSVINIVRIEPGMFDFRLLNASARNNVSKTPQTVGRDRRPGSGHQCQYVSGGPCN